MVKFGTTTLPLVEDIEDLTKVGYVERFIPGASVSKRIVRGAYGGDWSIRGLITSNVVATIAALKALADGTARALDFEDGSLVVPCLMIDPRFHKTGKPNQAGYDIRFVQTA